MKTKFEKNLDKVIERLPKDRMDNFSIMFFVLFIFKVLGLGMVATWSWWIVFLPLIIKVVGLLCNALTLTIEDDEKIKPII